MKTVKQFRKQLRSMIPYQDEIKIGNDVICKASGGYGVRNKDDESDPYTDYSPWVFGIKESWLIKRYLEEGLLVKESE